LLRSTRNDDLELEMTDEFPLVWIIPFVVLDPADRSLVYLAAAAQESIRGPVFELVAGP
jgi:hypothetical protein